MSENTPAENVFEVLHNMRAMRRLKSDQVPDALVDKIVRAGLAAPNGGNRQTWGFIVVRDAAIKQDIQRYYQQAFDEVVGPAYASNPPPPGVTEAEHRRQHAAVQYLTEHFHEAPVWIVACLDTGAGAPNRGSGASIYPAVQNMLLAARALGLGATLTTRHLLHGDAVDQILELPDGVRSYAIVPIGYPMGRFGPVRRAEAGIVFDDTWGHARTLSSG